MVFTKDNTRINDVKAWYKNIPKRIMCVSDTHGYSFFKLKSMLDEISFNENDYLYVLGDVIDRGSANDMLEFLRFIIKTPNVTLLMGNHEQMAFKNARLIETPHIPLNELTSEEDRNFRLWGCNGGDPTLEMFQNASATETKQILNLFRQAPLYKEVYVGDNHFVLCHSGLGAFDPEKLLNQYTAHDLLWYRPELNESFFIDSNTIVVFGHTPTVFMDNNNQGTPIFSRSWINIDTGAALGDPYAPCLLCLNDFSYVKPRYDEK